METRIHVTRIKLAKCLCESGCEHFKCQVNYTACTPLKAISAGCRATFLATRNPYSAKCPYAKKTQQLRTKVTLTISKMQF